MRSILASFLTLVVAILVGVCPARAQGSGSVELGLDAGFTLTMFDNVETFFGDYSPDDLISFVLPVQSFRVGVYVSDRAQIEPSLGIQVVSQGGESVRVIQLGVDALFELTSREDFELTSRENAAVPFLSVGGQIVSLEADGSATQVSLRAGVGVKLPAGDRLAVRLQALIGRAFETDDVLGSFDIGGRVGFSFFTR